MNDPAMATRDKDGHQFTLASRPMAGQDGRARRAETEGKGGEPLAWDPPRLLQPSIRFIGRRFHGGYSPRIPFDASDFFP